MYEKLGASLSDLQSVNLHFYGSKRTSEGTFSKNFHDDFSYSRNLGSKWRKVGSFYKIAKKLNPALIIVCSWELIIPALFIRLQRRALLLYDMQENYFHNYLYKNGYASPLRFLKALIPLLIEGVGSVFFNKVIAAESCYKNERPFLARNYILLENKALETSEIVNYPEKEYDLIYHGTLADQTGLKHVEELVSKNYLESKKLLIIGHSPKKEDQERIQKLEVKTNIEVEVSNSPIPHNLIMDGLIKSKASLSLYPIAAPIKNRTPTKFYEANSIGIPFIAFSSEHNKSLIEKGFKGCLLNKIEEIKNIAPEKTQFEDKRLFLWKDESRIFKNLILTMLDKKDG